jgi:hypothetical protein
MLHNLKIRSGKMSDVQAQPNDPQAEADQNTQAAATTAVAQVADSDQSAPVSSAPQFIVTYLDHNGAQQQYTLQDGEELDFHGMIQPAGIPVAQAAANLAAATAAATQASTDVAPATGDAQADAQQDAQPADADAAGADANNDAGAPVVAEDQPAAGSDTPAVADVPAETDTSGGDAGQPAQSDADNNAGNAATDGSAVVGPVAVDTPVDPSPEVPPATEEVDPAANAGTDATTGTDAPASGDTPAVDPVDPAAGGDTPADPVDPVTPVDSTIPTDPTTPVAGPSTGGDATGDDTPVDPITPVVDQPPVDPSVPVPPVPFTLASFLGANAITFTTSEDGSITYVSQDDLTKLLAQDAADIQPLVDAGTLAVETAADAGTGSDPVDPVTPIVPADPSTPDEPEQPAAPAEVEPAALGLIQSIIDDIGEFERHAVHSVISFIERLAPHHQKAIIEHFADKQ